MAAKQRTRVAFLGVPASALAALPLCPVCYPAYAGVLGALGLTSLEDTGIQAALTVTLMAVALGGLFYKAGSRRGYRPFALGVAAAVVLSFAKFVMGNDPLLYAAVAVLVAAGIWNSWPRSDGSCPIERKSPAFSAGGSLEDSQ